MKKKNELDKNKLHEAVDASVEACVVVSDRCVAIQATPVQALTLMTIFAQGLKDQVPVEVLIESVKLAYKSPEELMQMAVDAFKGKFK